MAAIKLMLDEVRFEMLKVIILNAFLDATILFLGLTLLLSVFSIGVIVPLILSLLFFAGDIYRYWTRINLSYVEERNPEIKEILRTAADNQDSDSLMAHALFAEVIQKIRAVSSGTFLDFQVLAMKIGVMFALSIIILSLAFFNVNIQKFENPLIAVGERARGIWSDFSGEETTPSLNLSEEDDIYGEYSVARLGSQDLDITLEQSLNQIDFNSVENADPQDAGGLDDYPVEVAAEAGQAFTDSIEDINDRKTAAEYSQEIKR
jgi:hypothetical protein